MEIRMLAATGMLGAGFSREGLAAAVRRKPDFIACDAGSTDSGPAALGSGRQKASHAALRRDLESLLLARDELGVPLIIGSCGTSGRDAGVDRVAGIVREIAEQHGLRLRLARIYAEQDSREIADLLRQGGLRPLPNAPDVREQDILDGHVVAMMGIEPIVGALDDGADVVLAGRASDTALYAALPQSRGADPGLTWHAAKTIECGAACALPPGADSLFVTLHDDHFTVETLVPERRLTPRSVAAHSLYENADPYLVTEPNGVLDTRDAVYEAVSDHCVRVSGAKFEPAADYTVKLEGAVLAGYQTIIVGGIRDRVVIDQMPELIPLAGKYFAERIADLFPGVDPATVDIAFTLYGTGGVLGDHELPSLPRPHEVGVLITVTAPSQELAHDVAAFVSHASAHLPIPQYGGLVSTIAYPFSPPEINRGATYRFTLKHTMTPADPLAPFRTTLENL
ncbi:acyclic terpene utilization AtuA family protein [Amycolatopsis sp. NPDC098790]|uniref:acyclic terpene utilization AtuA family protein n=1 Tax=Amycolatopsis sp. NPDC098790 TaxID=3363939 RepID=UPI0037F4DF9F